MSENTIRITISELQHLLDEQKRVTGEYMTRNLTTYSWFDFEKHDIDKTKAELRAEAVKSWFPDDFNVLKKYIK